MSHTTARPNVLWIFSDEHSHRFIGARQPHGEYAYTPNIDNLISRGVWFRHAYCQMPLCTPSRMCTLTGREARRAGAWDNGSVLRPEYNTLPLSLTDSGYSTCLVGKMHFGGANQMGGFQYRPYGDLTGNTGHQWEPIANLELAKGIEIRTAFTGETEIPESLLQDRIVATESVAWIRNHAAQHPDTPWMLCAGFSRPHFPLTAPGRWVEFYKNRTVSEPPVPASGDAWHHPMSMGMRAGFKASEISDKAMMGARASYLACVSYVDEVIGDLLNPLSAAGLLDNTIVIYASDHGEMAGEHGVWWKQGWYEGCTRVPLIIALPKSFKSYPRAIDEPVGLIDLFPTLCSLCGVGYPDDLDGEDISGAILGGSTPQRPIVCDNLVPRWGTGTEFRSVRYGSVKYVRFRGAEPLLFDVIEDPGEQKNLLVRGVPDGLRDESRIAENAAMEMDFDAAETERQQRDGDLLTAYPPPVEHGVGSEVLNCYTFPDGRIVAADDPIYSPRVVGESRL